MGTILLRGIHCVDIHVVFMISGSERCNCFEGYLCQAPVVLTLKTPLSTIRVVSNLFYKQVKSQLFMTCVFKHQDLQMFDVKLIKDRYYMTIFHPLVGRGRETQRQIYYRGIIDSFYIHHCQHVMWNN